MAQYPTSKIAMYNGLHSFYSLDSEVIDGVLDLSLSDPTYLAFRIFFDLESAGGLFGVESNTATDNCALSYLKRINDTNRYNALTTLIKLLKAVQTSAKHCFEAVDGLQDMWGRDVNNILLKDRKINVRLTESVDWRMTTIAALIRYVCYDHERLVYVLPENLRMFNMVIYVTELRIFASPIDKTLNTLDTKNASFFGIAESSFGDTKAEVFNDPDYINRFNEMQKKYAFRTPLTQALNDKLWGVKTSTAMSNDKPITYTNARDINVYCTQGAYIMFGLGDCTFDVSTGSAFFEPIDMTADPTLRSSNLTINYGSVHVSQQLPITGEFSDTLQSQKSVYKKPIMFEKLPTTEPQPGLAPMKTGTITNIKTGSFMGNLIRQVVSDLKDEALTFAKQFAQATTLNLMTEAAMQASRLTVGKLVGNAYNFNAVEFLTLTNPQMAFMKVKQGIKKAVTDNPATIAVNSNKRAMSQSPVYAEQHTNKQSMPIKNVFDKSKSL